MLSFESKIELVCYINIVDAKDNNKGYTVTVLSMLL